MFPWKRRLCSPARLLVWIIMRPGGISLKLLSEQRRSNNSSSAAAAPRYLWVLSPVWSPSLSQRPVSSGGRRVGPASRPPSEPPPLDCGSHPGRPPRSLSGWRRWPWNTGGHRLSVRWSNTNDSLQLDENPLSWRRRTVTSPCWVKTHIILCFIICSLYVTEPERLPVKWKAAQLSRDVQEELMLWSISQIINIDIN